MKIPTVSIIVPVYNAESYLHKCLESILNQTFKDFELILIDDGSTDSSGEICDDYNKKDCRIRVIHKLNEGVSIARNIGVEISKGKYIMFADADDYVELNWCEEMYSVITKNSNSMVISGICLYNERLKVNTKIYKKISDSEKSLRLTKKDLFFLYEKHLINSPCNKIFISKIIKDNNIKFDFNLSLGEDLLFNLNYLKKVDKDIFIINKCLYNYILRNEQCLDNKYYENLFEIYNKIYHEIYKCMLLFGTDINKNIPRYYNSYLYMLNAVLANTFNKKSKVSFIRKIKYNTKILKSAEFKNCIENANLEGFNKVNIKLFKTENYFLVYILNKFDFIKNKYFKVYVTDPN